jgi:hypothetical protein
VVEACHGFAGGAGATSGLDLLALLDQLPAVVWATRGAGLKHFGPGGDDLLGAAPGRATDRFDGICRAS